MKNINSVLLKRYYKLLSFLIVFSLIGCASMPSTFVVTYEPGWAAIAIKEGMKFENAWQEVLDVLAKKFELEMISRDGGYIRTAWIFTWWKVGERTENYRVRAIVKFSPDGRNVDIKTEANYLHSGQWMVGADTRLLETVKTDVMGVVGRTTR